MTPPHSAETIGNNIYLLTEILLRLTVKPLFRSKCVSKQWLSLISDPQFCLSHNRHHHSPYPTPTALLVYNSCPGILESYIIPLKHDTVCMDYLDVPGILLQSCNGLHLSCSWYFVEPSKECQLRTIRVDRCFISNPITKQFKNLAFPNPEFLDPAFKFMKLNHSLFNFSLVFDPLKSIHYKIIAFLPVKSQRQVDPETQSQMYIYTSDTDSWSPTEIICPPPRKGRNTVFCNGAIHWITWDRKLLYFDVDREWLNTTPLPKSSSYDIQYFGESRGHLHLIVKERGFKLEFDVLEMAMDYSGWFVRYHVNLDAMRIMFPKLFWHGEEEYKNVLKLLCVIRAEKEEESIVVVALNDRAISYNIRDGTSKELFDFEPKPKSAMDSFLRDCKAYQCFDILSCV